MLGKKQTVKFFLLHVLLEAFTISKAATFRKSLFKDKTKQNKKKMLSKNFKIK